MLLKYVSKTGQPMPDGMAATAKAALETAPAFRPTLIIGIDSALLTSLMESDAAKRELETLATMDEERLLIVRVRDPHVSIGSTDGLVSSAWPLLGDIDGLFPEELQYFKWLFDGIKVRLIDFNADCDALSFSRYWDAWEEHVEEEMGAFVTALAQYGEGASGLLLQSTESIALTTVSHPSDGDLKPLPIEGNDEFVCYCVSSPGVVTVVLDGVEGTATF